MRFQVLILCSTLLACSKAPEPLSSKTRSGKSPATSNGEIYSGEGDVKGTSNTSPADQKIVIEKVLDPAVDCSKEVLSGRPLLRLLTRDEYQNTITDILKTKVDYRAGLPLEIGKAGFKNNADAGTLSDSHISSYLNAAVQIAEEVKPQLQTLVGCNQDTAACASTLIGKLAPALWRRPLEAVETKELTDLYAATPADSDKLTVLVTRLLMSSNFLYRSEIGKSGTLTAYEMASALSYYFWGTAPDAALTDLAKSGAILTEATLAAQAERLFNDKKSRHLTEAFADAWIGPKKALSLNKDQKIFPAWTPELQAMLAEEAIGTFDYLVRLNSAKYEDLLTSNYSIGPAALATFYGSTSSMDNGVSKITHSSTPRKGVLGYGAVLAGLATGTESHPFKRGHFVLEHMLCHVPDPTPEGVVFQLPVADSTKSTRERFAQHSASPACKSCHEKIDNIGLGMEDFDGIGLFRATDNGKNVDSAGMLVGFDGKNTKFDGTGDLGVKLSESDRAKRCYTLQWFRMTRGYMERSNDVCVAREFSEGLSQGKLSLKDLIIKNITSPSYRKRGNP